MTNFVYSDPHFGHKNIVKFTHEYGTPLRPWNDVGEMDEDLVKWYNEMVQPQDKVYFLGDVAINRRCLATLGRLNGTKRLIKGNHDIFKLKDYMPYFKEIYAYRVFTKEGMIFSHIPIIQDCLARWGMNVHGHLHGNLLPRSAGKEYVSVCVEQTDYRPVPLEELSKLQEEQWSRRV